MAISRITASGVATDTLTAADLAPNSVDSSELVDGSVDLSHMSANSVDSDQYVDGSIDTAHLANNIAISTSGAITTTGAFTSVGIDDNADALAMTIDSSENIGLGTASPTGSGWDNNSRLLHIYQNATAGSLIKLESSNTTGFMVSGDEHFCLGTTTNDPVKFYQNGSLKYQIIDGEHRQRACMNLGYKKIPVNILSNISDEQAKKLTIIANETRGNADNISLSELLNDLSNGMSVDDLLIGLPYYKKELEDLINLGDVEWDRFGLETSGDDSSNQTDDVRFTVTCEEDTAEAFEVELRNLSNRFMGSRITRA